MTQQPGRPQRRRRRISTAQQAGAPPAAAPDAVAASADTTGAAELPLPGPGAAPGGPPVEPQPARRGGEAKRARAARPASADPTERGMRELVGAGRSQLGVNGALRGRDVYRPTEADLAEAEETVVLVRRHWQPTDKLGSPPTN